MGGAGVRGYAKVSRKRCGNKQKNLLIINIDCAIVYSETENERQTKTKTEREREKKARGRQRERVELASQSETCEFIIV